MCVCEICALLMMQIQVSLASQAPLMCQIYEAQFDTARVELTPGRPTTSRHVSDQREYVSWVIARVIAPAPINEFAPKESLIAIRLIKCLMTTHPTRPRIQLTLGIFLWTCRIELTLSIGHSRPCALRHHLRWTWMPSHVETVHFSFAAGRRAATL